MKWFSIFCYLSYRMIHICYFQSPFLRNDKHVLFWFAFLYGTIRIFYFQLPFLPKDKEFIFPITALTKWKTICYSQRPFWIELLFSIAFQQLLHFPIRFRYWKKGVCNRCAISLDCLKLLLNYFVFFQGNYKQVEETLQILDFYQ